MDLSKVRQSLPGNVSLVALDRSFDVDFEIFPEEEHLLPAKTSPERWVEFRLGRHAAHLALVEIGCEPEPVLRGPNREPIWPPGVVGSITHDGNHVMAAVAWNSDAAGIGIDLELIGRYFPGLETEIASGTELAALTRLEGRSREEATIEVFSAKETIYKAHYPRIGRFFG
ncbi:MAG TPA: 4'-phosphopantetheinyl transferase superfamily protein, partial [Acidimicrobiia bacterium]